MTSGCASFDDVLQQLDQAQTSFRETWNVPRSRKVPHLTSAPQLQLSVPPILSKKSAKTQPSFNVKPSSSRLFEKRFSKTRRCDACAIHSKNLFSRFVLPKSKKKKRKFCHYEALCNFQVAPLSTPESRVHIIIFQFQ